MNSYKEGDMSGHSHLLISKSVYGKTVFTMFNCNKQGIIWVFSLLWFLVLVACGGETAVSPITNTTPQEAATDVPLIEEAQNETNDTSENLSSEEFSISIEHKFGTLELSEVPERVVSVGYSEQDALLALGVTPVAVRDWFGEQPYGVWTWSQHALGNAQPVLMQMPFGELNYEQITQLNPDLIVATHSGITADEYELLSNIAPVLAQPAEYPDFGVPWQVQTELIGQAIGQATEATELINFVEGAITSANESNQGFNGATVAWATPVGDGTFYLVGENTPPMRFLARLGLVNDPAIQELVSGLDSAVLSEEQIGMLEVDLLILHTPTDEERATLEANPLLSQLDVFQEDRVLFFVGNDPIYGALSFSTVSSLPYLIDELVPQIAERLDIEMTEVEEETVTEGNTRIIVDATGTEVEVPANPQRVVVLSELDLDSALAVGVKPVGATNGRGQQTLPSYLLDQTDGIESIGTIAEPNPEVIASLNPDLIIVGSPIPPVQSLLPDLAQIAPVAVTFVAGSSWQDSLLGVAHTLNRTTEAEAFLAEYAERVNTIASHIPAELTEVSVIRWMADGPLVMLPNSFSSLVLADVGIGRPTAHADMAGFHPVHSDVISMEQIQVIDADLIFAGGINSDGNSALDDALDNVLVQGLTAVQTNRIIIVDGLVWGSVGGPLAAMHVLDDIERSLETFNTLSLPNEG